MVHCFCPERVTALSIPAEGQHMWYRVHWPGLDFTRILKDTHFEIAGAEEIQKKKKNNNNNTSICENMRWCP